VANLTLYERGNARGDCTSPFVWRVKFALQQKGLIYKRVPVGFVDIPQIGSGRFATVPVVECEGHFIRESWDIAEWLDAQFPNHPPLFSSVAELSMVRFFDKWFGTAIMPLMFRSCVLDIFTHLKPQDRNHFRTTRERQFGLSLEDVSARADHHVAKIRDAILPLRLALRREFFLGAANPNYADYIAWGVFIAFGSVAVRPVLATDDPLNRWLGRGVEMAGMQVPPTYVPTSKVVDRTVLTRASANDRI
jgi:glutathione S-transferase